MVVSQGAFYLTPEDADGCNQLRLQNGNKPLNGNQYHFRNSEEMNTLFKEYPEALACTERVARQCLQL
jgi:DNA polymerase III alpha subunit